MRNVPIKGVTTPTWAIDTLKGDISPVVLTGRAPTSADEIAFGPGTMHDLGLQIGDRVAVGNTKGHTAKVVGVALVPASSHTDYDQSALMTAAGLRAAVGPVGKLDPNVFEDYVLVKWAKGANVAAAEHGLAAGEQNSSTFESARARRCRPRSRAWAGCVRSHSRSACSSHCSQRRRLRTHSSRRCAGGDTSWPCCARSASRGAKRAWRSRGRRRSSRWSAWSSGVPLGIVAGRLVWRWLAHNFPVVYVPPLALVAVVLVLPAAVVVANLLAAWPARSAARIRPAEALRAE